MLVCNDACPDHQTTSIIVVLFDSVREQISTPRFSPDENLSRVDVQTESRLITEETTFPYDLLFKTDILGTMLDGPFCGSQSSIPTTGHLTSR
ncbi:hypothetical protein TNCV_5066061 [Trichonephila clavipes]|nr:hypothetical protein TNCV_5066061 [Trichonephila clavipes]